MYKFDLPFELIWQRLENLVMEGSSKNLLIKMINNIIPNRSRLFSMNKALHPWCTSSTCLARMMTMGPLPAGVRDRTSMWQEVGGVVEDITHQFTGCPRVEEVWGWLRGRIVRELFSNGQQENCSNFELLHLSFPQTQHDTTIVWMISIYVDFIYNELVIMDRNFNVEKFKAILYAKYCPDWAKAKLKFSPIGHYNPCKTNNNNNNKTPELNIPPIQYNHQSIHAKEN
jgi:hypothetical protein